MYSTLSCMRCRGAGVDLKVSLLEHHRAVPTHEHAQNDGGDVSHSPSRCRRVAGEAEMLPGEACATSALKFCGRREKRMEE